MSMSVELIVDCNLLLTVMTELHEATSLGDLERVEEILKRGLNPNEPDSEWADRTPLHIAASNGFKKCLYVLLEAGANLNATTSNGWTPAHFACETGQLQCLQTLISFGCDLTAADTSGDTPLKVAQVYAHRDCVDTILKKLQSSE